MKPTVKRYFGSNVPKKEDGSVIADFYFIVYYDKKDQLNEVTGTVDKMLMTLSSIVQVDKMNNYYLYYGFANIINLDPLKNESTFYDYLVLALRESKNQAGIKGNLFIKFQSI